MLSKNRTRFINSLKLKKNRKAEQLFIVEGAKNVLELLHSNYLIHSLYCTESFMQVNSKVIKQRDLSIDIVDAEQLSSAGTFQTNKMALAIAEIKENNPLAIDKDEFAIILDDIRDPGNFGTILRIADWYDIKKIISSESSVDLYNPKVINASMGSFTRVEVYYTELRNFIKVNPGPYYGAFLDGENINKVHFPDSGYIVIGNESAGIDKSLESMMDFRISIPRYGNAESLNAGIATAIICDNLRRSISTGL